MFARTHARRPLVTVAILVVALLGLMGLAPVRAVSPDVVISQVYGGGGNSGATLRNDFIELFNRGTSSVDLTGWSVQYASAAGNTWQRTDLAGTIAPGQYFLVQEAAGAGGTTQLPTPDATGSIPMGATAGKVALVTNQTTLTCGATAGSCLPNPSIRDLVGYGSTASDFEGSGPTPPPSNTTAALRAMNGCTDTDNNAADFSTGAPNPRNTASPLHDCDDDPVIADCGPTLETPEGTPATTSVSASDGDDTVIDVSITGVTPSPAPGTITLHDLVAAPGDGGTATANVTIDGATPIDVYSVQITATNDDSSPQTGTCVLTIRVEGAPTLIREIQASAHLSPRDGDTVFNVPGIVTARRSNGFYFQDPDPDADDATSEGLFVFTSSAPTVAVGDSVLVDGRVDEFRPGGETGTNLTITELVNPHVTLVPTENPLPPATVIGTGGRVPPATVIEDDATGNVETSGVFDPASDGIDFYESLEGMRVRVNDAVATGPTNAFGEISVVGDGGAHAGVRTARGGIVIRPNDFNPERIILDDVLAPTPDVNTGDGFGAPLVGVMDYSFGNFKLLVTEAPVPIDEGLAREITSPAGPGQLSVASFNVENLDPGDGPRIVAIAEEIVTNLRSPDLIGVQEIQDNNGATNDAIVDASDSFTALITAIRVAGGPTYEFRQINPVDDQDGGEPGGNIRVGFLFRADRGLAFVDRAGGTSTSSTTVVSGPDGPELSASPGRIAPTDPAFANSRKPLVGEFTHFGRRLFVVVNHFNSKGGDDPLFGRFQPPTLSSEAQRIQQAQIVNDFVDQILTIDGDAAVVVMGDLNDFEFSTPLSVLKGGVLHALVESLPQNERYSYVFDGNSQTLDHILVSDGLFGDVSGYDAVHMNAEFAERPTDHDPPVSLLCTDETAPDLSATASPSVLFPPNHKYVTVNTTVTVADDQDPNVTATLVSVTSNEPDDAPGMHDGNTRNDIVIVDGDTFRLRAERSELGTGRTYTITYQATDACGNSSTAAVTVTVPVRS